MEQQERKIKITSAGIFLTIIVTAGFVWAAYQWRSRNNWQPQQFSNDMNANEQKAFTSLQLIAQAQEKYRTTDWDNDSNNTYAQFFVHLWKSVDKDNKQIDVGLIPKKLAFAMAGSRAVDGYFFVDVHKKKASEKEDAVNLDYKQEWVIAAVPVAANKTGRLIFLAKNPANFLVKEGVEAPPEYPLDHNASGWKSITNLEQLADFQDSLAGPKK